MPTRESRWHSLWPSAAHHGPRGLALDRAGNVVIADRYDDRARVAAVRSGTFYGRRMTALHMYMIAGGGAGVVPDNRLATRILLLGPQGVTTDRAGDAMVNAVREARGILVRA